MIFESDAIVMAPFYARGRSGSRNSVVVAAASRHLTVRREVAEPRDRGFERQIDGAGRAVALLADDDFGLAVREVHVQPPFLVLGRARARLLHGEVVFLAIDEQHDVSVLLDR